MADTCPFCKSKNIVIDTPYIDKFGDKITTYCCAAQDRNQKYLRGRVNPWAPFEKNDKDPSKF